jgi:hypothetical protein
MAQNLRPPGGNIEWTKIKPEDVVIDGGTHWQVNGTHVAYWGSHDATDAQLWLKRRAIADQGRTVPADPDRLPPPTPEGERLLEKLFPGANDDRERSESVVGGDGA